MKILVTGCAGFIGSNLVDRLLSDNHEVIGVDDFNDYYDPKIKEDNLKSALGFHSFKLYRGDIQNFPAMCDIFEQKRPERVIHLAARAGVRPSIANPLIYSQVNTLGTVNLLKLSVDFSIGGFIFGSSSSVYGNSPRLPFGEDDQCQNIISPYGASKRSAEFFVESFYHTYNLKATILRFFTVYGPRGRPDMAPALFSRAILGGGEIRQFGDGSTSRDYTFVDDVVDGIVKAVDAELDFEIINLGNNHPVNLRDFIKTLQETIGKKVKIIEKPLPPGDAPKTWANIDKAKKLLLWKPKTKLRDGLTRYVEWLRHRA